MFWNMPDNSVVLPGLTTTAGMVGQWGSWQSPEVVKLPVMRTCRRTGVKIQRLKSIYFLLATAIPACTDFEVIQFPLRMRDWLKNILMQLYEPNPEHAGYLNEKQRNKVSYPLVSYVRVCLQGLRQKGVCGGHKGWLPLPACWQKPTLPPYT